MLGSFGLGLFNTFSNRAALGVRAALNLSLFVYQELTLDPL